jgi:hypothetical protein
MKDRQRTFVSALLFTLAAVFLALLVVLIAWGGRIEATFLVLGKPVFLVLDSRLPRVLLLLVPPMVLGLGALSVRAGRHSPSESPPGRER